MGSADVLARRAVMGVGRSPTEETEMADHDLDVARAGEWPIERVRAGRAELQEVETGLSYLRRRVQGHHDIVHAEQARRAGGAEGGDVGHLVDPLPQVLAPAASAPWPGRLPENLGPGRAAEDLEPELHAIMAGSTPTEPGGAEATSLEDLAASLADLEQRVSPRRHALFGPIDALTAELTRRYRTGEAEVDDLLP